MQMLPLLLSKKEVWQNKFLLLTYEILCSPLIFRIGVGIIAYFVRILEHAWKNLASGEIGSDCDYETKHSEATI